LRQSRNNFTAALQKLHVGAERMWYADTHMRHRSTEQFRVSGKQSFWANRGRHRRHCGCL